MLWSIAEIHTEIETGSELISDPNREEDCQLRLSLKDPASTVNLLCWYKRSGLQKSCESEVGWGEISTARKAKGVLRLWVKEKINKWNKNCSRVWAQNVDTIHGWNRLGWFVISARILLVMERQWRRAIVEFRIVREWGFAESMQIAHASPPLMFFRNR